MIDAVVVRCLLVPALVALFGRANWWLPSSLARLLRIPKELDERIGRVASENDNSINEGGFRIERGLSSLGPWSTVGSVSPGVMAFSDLGVAGGGVSPTDFVIEWMNNSPVDVAQVSSRNRCTTISCRPTPWTYVPSR